MRICRAALCLLVVCCLIVNISPIKAKATTVAVAATAVSVPGLNVIAGVLIGLGVLVGIATTDWDKVLNDCETHLRSMGFVDENGNISIVKFGTQPDDPNGGLATWFADLALIEAIREWLFTEEVVTESVVPDGYAYYNGVLLPVIPEYDFPFVAVTYYDSNLAYTVTYSTTELIVYSKYLYTPSNKASDSVCAYLFSPHTTWGDFSSVTYYPFNRAITSFNDLIWSNYDLYDSDGNLVLASSESVTASSVETSLDVSLGEVATSDTAIADGYTTWAENATTVSGSTLGGSDDEEITVFPIGIGQTWEETRDLTQEDVWAGTSTYVDSTVIGIDLSRTPTSCYAGLSIGIAIDVTGIGVYDANCTCTVSGGTSSGTYVELDSSMDTPNLYTLYVGADETAESLAITATSVQDPSISATHTVTVSEVATTDPTSGDSSGDGSSSETDEKLDDILSGGESGSDLTDKSGQLGDDMGDISDFEQSQKDVLDNSMEQLQSSVVFVDFVPAMAFVQSYIDRIWEGVPSIWILFTVPLFLGLFFYLCSRVPGATRWRAVSPPKSGKKKG